MEKDIYSPASMPCSSQVLELTMPMDAVAEAPIWPTMAASMYSIAVTTICCRMDGMLKVSTIWAVCCSGTCSPCRILAESCSRVMDMDSSLRVRKTDNESGHLL